MSTKHFHEFVESLRNNTESIRNNLTDQKIELWHSATGIAGESGELLDIVKKIVAYDKPLDKDKLLDEAGDVIHYVAQLLNVLGLTIDDAIDNNKTKLKKRYPNGNTTSHIKKNS